MPSSEQDHRATEPAPRQFFEQEVGRLMDRLYGTALRLTRDANEAEEIVAEAVGKAWDKFDRLRDRAHFEGWLFRILNNCFISDWRRKRRRADHEQTVDFQDREGGQALEFSLFEQLHQPFLLWWGTPEQRFLDGVLQEDIQRALDELPDPYRVAIVLVEVQGYTYQEAAELLAVPLGTVRSRLNRARSLLQKTLWEQARDAGIAAGGRGECTGRRNR